MTHFRTLISEMCLNTQLQKKKKKQPSNWENFAFHKSDKGVIYKIT